MHLFIFILLVFVTVLLVASAAAAPALALPFASGANNPNVTSLAFGDHELPPGQQRVDQDVAGNKQEPWAKLRPRDTFCLFLACLFSILIFKPARAAAII